MEDGGWGTESGEWGSVLPEQICMSQNVGGYEFLWAIVLVMQNPNNDSLP